MLLSAFICTCIALLSTFDCRACLYQHERHSALGMALASEGLVQYSLTKSLQLIQRSNFSSCFPLNSDSWLRRPRLGNSNDSSLDENYARQLILTEAPNMLHHSKPFVPSKYAKYALGQSICREGSRLLDLKRALEEVKGDDEEGTKNLIRIWTVRLVYLSAHYHQHRPAADEAFHRLSITGQRKKECRAERKGYLVGNFDFECKQAKFLVVRFFQNGIGANMRLAAVPALMAGLATGRIVLFINNAPSGPDFLQRPWDLASCARRDAQCFFMPASPCVLTLEEIDSAYTLGRSEMRQIFRTGAIPADHKSDRVLILQLSYRPQRTPPNLRSAIYSLAKPVVEQLLKEKHEDKSVTTKNSSQDFASHPLKAALRSILHEEMSPKDSYEYYGANSPVFHGLLLYALRPMPRARASIDEVVNEVLPLDFETEHAIGLPIRGSDKCETESDCLSFTQYLRAATQLVQANLKQSRTTSIIITTESEAVFKEIQDYFSLSANATQLPLRFLLNHRDIRQNSGFAKDFITSPKISADQVMHSAISSLALQLTPGLTVGNCCSNFHLMLADFLHSGCGTASSNKFQCLQDNSDPDLRVCCKWDKTPVCLKRRNQTVSQ